MSKPSKLICPKCSHNYYVPKYPYLLDIRLCLKCKYEGN